VAGYIVLRGFLTEEEVRPIEAVYDKFMRREITVPGKVRHAPAGGEGGARG
jgi:hypothetical protein